MSTACFDSANIATIPDLVPVRMLNEYAYCPRLCWIEWVEGEFVESSDTVEGTFQHRRVDKEQGDISEPGQASEKGKETAEGEVATVEDPVVAQARSVMMSAANLGLIAKIDLVEEQGGRAVPVDVKRGAAPDIPEGAYEPERVQVCAQGLILRENGYSCERGMVYFAQSRRRVAVPLDEALVARTLDLLAQMRSMAASGVRPPPLDGSPKCPRCSLVSVCLPDETNTLLAGEVPAEEDRVRRLTPARDDALPLYVQKHGAVLGKRGDRLAVSVRGEVLQETRLMETSQVCVFGGAQLTTPAIQECLSRGIPVLFFSFGGWFYGMTHGLGHKNVGLRQAQYRAAENPERCLGLARDLVRVKILNARTMLRRNHPDAPSAALDSLKKYAEGAAAAESLESLLGVEGMAAKTYFAHFGALLKPVAAAKSEENHPSQGNIPLNPPSKGDNSSGPISKGDIPLDPPLKGDISRGSTSNGDIPLDPPSKGDIPLAPPSKGDIPLAPPSKGDISVDPPSKGDKGGCNNEFNFAFEHRNRRPPRDPVNAMLSFAYALFTKDWTITLAAVGFDPYLGFYHQPRYGRPALALDMMEPFRPLIPDSVVLWAVNNGVVTPDDFIRRAGGVALKDEPRRKFILAYEKRMDDLVTHPVFNYRISYRRILEVQARLLARMLTGEIDRLPDFLTR